MYRALGKREHRPSLNDVMTERDRLLIDAQFMTLAVTERAEVLGYSLLSSLFTLRHLPTVARPPIRLGRNARGSGTFSLTYPGFPGFVECRLCCLASN